MENGSKGKKNVGEGEFFPSALIKDYLKNFQRSNS